MSVTNNFTMPRFLMNIALSYGLINHVMHTKETQESSLPTKVAKAAFSISLATAVLDKTAGSMPIPFAIGGTLLAGKVLGNAKSFPATLVAGVVSPGAFAVGGYATQIAVENPTGFLDGLFSALGQLPGIINGLFNAQTAIFAETFKRF